MYGFSSTVTINIDSDGDGYTDNNDLDDDNDGILDCIENGLNGSVTDYLKLSGNASKITNNEVQLTPAAMDKAGTAMSIGKINLNNNFSFTIEANFGNIDGADGMAFVFHNDPAGKDALGGFAAGLGAYGIQNGFVIEFDTYNNTPSINDIPQDHATFWDTDAALAPGQSLPPILRPNVALGIGGNIEDGNWHTITFTWNATTKTISYNFDNTWSDSFSDPNFINNFFSGNNMVHFGIAAGTGGQYNDQRIRITSACALPIVLDNDGDGIPNNLDLDSDNDGCPDAVEGDENVTAAQLTANRISGTVDANGVPNLVNAGGASDVGSDQGQGIGEAYNAAIQSGCFCYKSAVTSGTILDTNHGITALGRAGTENGNWPMVRKGAWTVLEAKTKGFVVNRLTDAQIIAIPAANLVEGMMVYNINQDCLQINIDGTAAGWKCFNTQTCPD